MQSTRSRWMGLGALVAAAACGGGGGTGSGPGNDASVDDGSMPDATSSGGEGGSVEAGGSEGGSPDGGARDSGTPRDGGATDSGTSSGTDAAPTDSGSPADSGSSTDGGSVASGDSVLMHHKNVNRDGLYVQPAFTKAAISTLHKDTGFTASLPASKDFVYAQPLFVDGMGQGPDLVLVATEANNVYALNAATGAQAWVKNLGAPVPQSSMSCGNIDPFGVTGTPVIDWATRTMFLDALVLVNNAAKHEIFALSIDTGAIQSGWPIVVDTVAKTGGTTFSDKNHGERGALAVVGGTLYVPFGGLFGDCNPYNGWILAISIANPSSVVPWATTLRGGGIWAPAGISSDGTDLYVATGNTFNGNNTWGGGDAILRFGTGSAFGTLADYYAPTEWQSLDNSDLDMGPTPIVFDLAGATPSHLAITFGKDGDAYLLDRTHLGGVGNALSHAGGQSYTLHVASNEIISAPVLYTTPTATYSVFKGAGTLCTNGTSGYLTTVKIVPGSPPTLAASWCAGSGSGSPIVTTSDGTNDAIVWDLGSEGDQKLEAFDGDTGAPITFTGSTVTIPNMRRYNAPIAAKGRIYVPADNAVVAFTL